MKKLLQLLMILSLILTLAGCQTAKEVPVYEVPDFSLSLPSRPILKDLPSDESGAIRTLADNLRAVVAYSEKLEVTYQAMESYYRTVINIITR